VNRHTVTVTVTTRHTFVVEMPPGDAFVQATEATDQVRNRWGMGERAEQSRTAAPSFRWEYATADRL
jgi:hypothetical protein